MRWDKYTGYEGKMKLTKLEGHSLSREPEKNFTWCSGRLNTKVKNLPPAPRPPRPSPNCQSGTWCDADVISPFTSCSPSCVGPPPSSAPPPGPYNQSLGPQNSPSCTNLVSCDGMLHKNYYTGIYDVAGRKQLVNINNQMCSAGRVPDTFYGFPVTNVGVGICNQPTNMNFKKSDENYKNWCGEDISNCDDEDYDDYKKLGQVLCRYRNGLVPCIPSYLIGQPQYSNIFLYDNPGTWRWKNLSKAARRRARAAWLAENVAKEAKKVWNPETESQMTNPTKVGSLPLYFRPINQDLKNLSDGGQSLNYKNIKKCYESISPS
ncbi:hypothetical protein OAK19_05945, partial [Aureispira]|nr:hypothetical protein [Aureispira sp.]